MLFHPAHGLVYPNARRDSLLFIHLNLGKRSVTLDRSSHAWRAALAKLGRR
jgi:hypothetical protein